jgi:hypothetical protein
LTNIQNDLQQAYEVFLRKKKAYGNSDKKTAEALAVFFPQGIAPESFDDATLIAHILEKLSRVASGNLTREQKVDAYQDIAGYAILGVHKDEKETEEQELGPEDVLDDLAT